MNVKEEEQELDYVERQIRDHILQNREKRLTDNKVVLAMVKQGICSRMTCLKKIKGLEERGIIEDIRTKEDDFSWLVIKNQNEFGLISKQLTEIESVIKANAESVHKLIEASVSNHPITLVSYSVNFLFPYLESVSTTLRMLLVGTDRMIHSKIDSQTLHTRIINLMIELTLQAYDLNNAKNLLFITRTKMTKARDELKNPGTKNDFVSFKTVDRVIKMLDNFESTILPLIK